MRGKLSTSVSAADSAAIAKSRRLVGSMAIAGAMAAIAAGWSVPAFAQAAPQKTPAATVGVGEIVVTAQKRAQNI